MEFFENFMVTFCSNEDIETHNQFLAKHTHTHTHTRTRARARTRTHTHTHVYTRYTGSPRRNGQNFGRVFLMLNYTDITQNTYIQS